MAANEQQKYENHRKFVPAYHYVTFPILAVNLVWSLYQLAVGFSMATVVTALVAMALISLCLHLRFFPITVQDRVIRLEEQLRLERLLPHDERRRIDDLTIDQFIGLRFASDAEAADLALAVLNEGLDDREAIKKRVTDWRPDHLRA